MSIKSNTVFSKDSSRDPVSVVKESDGRKISYWLERLYRQGEVLRRKNPSGISIDYKNTRSEEIISKKTQDLTQSGINENTKNLATKKEADMQAVNDLVKKSNRRIISISSLFPWDLFANTIDVEESRVTFKFRQFLTSQTHSVDIKDISNVFIESSLFFATLQIVSRTYVENEIKIGNLSKTKAKKVQKIIEGLRTFAEHDINTSNYEIEELIAKIEEFHTSAAVE